MFKRYGCCNEKASLKNRYMRIQFLNIYILFRKKPLTIDLTLTDRMEGGGALGKKTNLYLSPESSYVLATHQSPMGYHPC